MLRGYVPRQTFTHLHFWSISDFALFLRVLGLRARSLTSGFEDPIDVVAKAIEKTA